MRWERGVFKFDKAVEGGISSKEYWYEAGKADDRIMRPAPRPVSPWDADLVIPTVRHVIPQRRYKMPHYHILDRDEETGVGVYDGHWD